MYKKLYKNIHFLKQFYLKFLNINIFRLPLFIFLDFIFGKIRFFTFRELYSTDIDTLFKYFERSY